MKTHFYSKCFSVIIVLFLWTTNLIGQVVGPVIVGPAGLGMLEIIDGGLTQGVVYDTDPTGSGYKWAVSEAGTIISGDGTASITVDWTNPVRQQTVSVTYTDANGAQSAVLIVNYYPYPAAIDPTIIPKFVDPLPHFAGGLRVNAKAGGNMTITAKPVKQVALSTGTPVSMGTAPDGTPLTGTIGTTPGAGVGNYAGYEITYNGTTYPAMWPARTIETSQSNGLFVTYVNSLNGVRYSDFNILADQTLMMNGYTLTGNELTDPYTGPIPMVVHLHGGEMPSGSDGGPNAWFMPTGTTKFKEFGPRYQNNQSVVSIYPNQQEATTLWYHPHDDGLTRINVYTGLAGYYFLRGTDEETAQLPGWSGDGHVQEVTPDGKSATFYPGTPYLPEIEIAIQDRMFNNRGELYWPVAPPNPEIHPFWTPEFVGDVMTVNGKTWPYLSVAPRKYRFRFLEGCNARFLNMWLVNAADGKSGPVINVIGGEGGLLATPEPVQTLLMAPGQRYDVIIDFTGFAGQTFTLMNDAGAPYPDGDPVTSETSQIMQFVVNGLEVEPDNSQLPTELRPDHPLVALTDFNGSLSPNVTPINKRQIVLNEVSAGGGPAAVLVNNSFFDAALALPGTPIVPGTVPPALAGGPTELPVEGTTETFSIINISADAHPIHIHLLQWQLVGRQTLDVNGYMTAYTNAFIGKGYNPADFPGGLGYPGGGGPPLPYNTINSDGAIGGNPPLNGFVGPFMPANPEEKGWKDNVIVMPGEVTTFVVRVAPTDKPIVPNPLKPEEQLLFPFDPSSGPGYVWHCHIVDHEDMSMMRPLEILPSVLRFPQISIQPKNVTACNGDVITFTADGTSLDQNATITYQWQVLANGTWTDLTDGGPYSGAINSTLSVSTAAATGLSGNSYRCVLTNPSGVTNSNVALLTINNCSISGTVSYNNNVGPVSLSGLVINVSSVSGKTWSATTDPLGAFTITGVNSGTHAVTITNALAAGGINSTDAGIVNASAGTTLPNIKFLAGDVISDGSIANSDALGILNNFAGINGSSFTKPWVYSDALKSATTTPLPLEVTVDAKLGVVNGTSLTVFDILALSTGDFNGSYNPVTPGVSTVLLASSGIGIKVPVATPFDLPINSVSPITQVGAISLILNVPSTLVTVNSVQVAGNGTPVIWSYANNMLRIGWYSTTPLNIAAGGNLVIINMTPTAGFTSTQTLKLTLVASYLNELADGLFVPIPNPSLTVDNVQVTAKASTTTAITLSMVPNPVTKGQTVTINYTLPSPGNISIGVFDTKGVSVLPIISNQPSDQVANPLNGVSLGNLIKGNYYLRLTLIPTTNGLVPQTVAIKIMIK